MVNLKRKGHILVMVEWHNEQILDVKCMNLSKCSLDGDNRRVQPIDDRSQLHRRRSVEKLLSHVQLVIGSVQLILWRQNRFGKRFTSHC